VARMRFEEPWLRRQELANGLGVPGVAEPGKVTTAEHQESRTWRRETAGKKADLLGEREKG
jgi:hypothetical protein